MKSLIRLSVIISVTHLLITMSKAQWCVEKKRVAKTRLQWNEGERFITKRDFFLRTKLKRVPYVFTSKEVSKVRQNYYLKVRSKYIYLKIGSKTRKRKGKFYIAWYEFLTPNIIN